MIDAPLPPGSARVEGFQAAQYVPTGEWPILADGVFHARKLCFCGLVSRGLVDLAQVGDLPQRILILAFGFVNQLDTALMRCLTQFGESLHGSRSSPRTV